jgi:hypothetical protein
MIISTLDSMNNSTNLFYNIGKFDKPEPLYMELLNKRYIYIVFGDDHHLVIETYEVIK